jgi:aldehyde dehydrogenase (NAD+)
MSRLHRSRRVAVEQNGRQRLTSMDRRLRTHRPQEVHTVATPAAQRTTTIYSGFDQLPIGGRWRKGRSATVNRDRNPWTGGVLLETAQASLEDLNEAYSTALEAQRTWGALLPGERAAVMRRAVAVMNRRRDEILSWLVRESGSTLLKAALEWEAVEGVLHEASTLPYLAEGPIIPADLPGKESRVYRQPVGVGGVISPWNWPLQLTARSICPALAVGNAVVLKPATDPPVTGGLLHAKILEEAGLPPGVLSVCVGAGSDIGAAFVMHPTPRVISFTGSTPVGRQIAGQAAGAPIMKRIHLELGGNCPFVGDPETPDTMIGPLINQSQFDRLWKLIQDARVSGSRQVVGGEPHRLVMRPHVFADVRNEQPLAQEELFGPVAPIIRANGEEEAIAFANDTSYGLSSAVFTSDVERGVRFGRRVEAGMTHVNDQPVNDLPFSPFGGEKNSGIGRFNGRWAVEAFTTDHWITVQHVPRRYPRDARELRRGAADQER